MDCGGNQLLLGAWRPMLRVVVSGQMATFDDGVFVWGSQVTSGGNLLVNSTLACL